jgi:hypothetical protein
MKAIDARKAIQEILGVEEDGIMGKRTDAAYALLDQLPDDAEWPDNAPTEGWHSGKASSFADPADIRAFDRCKATGKTDRQCFAVGDNGIGKWGDSTRSGTGPSCALPPEDWRQFGSAARGKLVRVKANGKEVVCALKDTMPAKANVKNGAILDLNPDAAAALGLTPPFMVDAEWSWA